MPILTGIPRPHVSKQLPKNRQGRGVSREMNSAAGHNVTGTKGQTAYRTAKGGTTARPMTRKTSSYKTSVKGMGPGAPRRRRRTRLLRRG